MSEFSDRLLVTKADAARLLSVSPRTVFELRRRGEIHVVHVLGAPRYSVAELEQWIAKQVSQSLSDSNGSSIPCGKHENRNGAMQEAVH